MLGRKNTGRPYRGAVRLPWRRLTLGGLLLFLAAATPGCGGGGGDSGDGGGNQIDEVELRRRFIQTVGNGFILPTYTFLVEEADRLRDAAASFCDNRTIETLTSAQQQWRLVTGLWMESELVNVRFGPGTRWANSSACPGLAANTPTRTTSRPELGMAGPGGGERTGPGRHRIPAVRKFP